MYSKYVRCLKIRNTPWSTAYFVSVRESWEKQEHTSYFCTEKYQESVLTICSEVRPRSQNCGWFHPTGVCCHERKSSKITVVLHFLQKSCLLSHVVFSLLLSQDGPRFTLWHTERLCGCVLMGARLLVYTYCVCLHFSGMFVWLCWQQRSGSAGHSLDNSHSVRKCNWNFFFCKNFNRACEIFSCANIVKDRDGKTCLHLKMYNLRIVSDSDWWMW